MSKTKTVVIHPEVTLCNPEDFFNDLIKDGCTVHEALMTIMEDELVNAELQREYPDYEVHPDEGWDNPTPGHYIIRLEKRHDASDDMTLIASDADRAEA